MKKNSIWKPIVLSKKWKECDTSVLDDISESWFARRDILKTDSKEYADFLNRLKREHAIETGIIENMYDLKRGITATFIIEGFNEGLLSHGDTDIPKHTLMNHLHDHLESVNFIFDRVKKKKALTTGFIKELHQLVTNHQEYTEAIDSFGKKGNLKLLKGAYKTTPNNPRRKDGNIIEYCPPEKTASEMDNLITIYEEHSIKNLHPLLLATWFHHAFTTIHPFQDGNGRVARLLASLIFITHDYFPFTVLRAEAKAKYIQSLEEADKGNPQPLINYFAEVQKRNIQKALNLKEVSTSTSLQTVQNIFIKKVEESKKQKDTTHQEMLSNNRNSVFDYCKEALEDLQNTLQSSMENDTATIVIESCSFEDTEKQHYFHRQIVRCAKKHDYFFNYNLSKAWIMFRITIGKQTYQLGISIHHYGYSDTTLAISSFLESKDFSKTKSKSKNSNDEKTYATPLDIPPHVISISSKDKSDKDNINSKKKNIQLYLETALTLTLAQISSEI